MKIAVANRVRKIHPLIKTFLACFVAILIMKQFQK